MILSFIILGGYVIIFSAYVFIFGAAFITFGAYSIILKVKTRDKIKFWEKKSLDNRRLTR